MLFDFRLDIFSRWIIWESFVLPAGDHRVEATGARGLRETFDLKGIHQAEDMCANQVVESLEGAATVDLLGDKIPFY